MSKELTDLFKNTEISEAQNFSSIKISLAFFFFFTELLDLKKMVYFVQEFLAQLKIMNVCVENINV